jgi:hypothetical protein
MDVAIQIPSVTAGFRVSRELRHQPDLNPFRRSAEIWLRRALCSVTPSRTAASSSERERHPDFLSCQLD